MELGGLSYRVVLGTNSICILGDRRIRSCRSVNRSARTIVLGVVPGTVTPCISSPRVIPDFGRPRNRTLRFVEGTVSVFRKCRRCGDGLVDVGMETIVCDITCCLVHSYVSGSVRCIRNSRTSSFSYTGDTVECVRSGCGRRVALGRVTGCMNVAPTRFSGCFGSGASRAFSGCLHHIHLRRTVSSLEGGGVAIERTTVRGNFPGMGSFVLFYGSRCNEAPTRLEGCDRGG